MLRTYRTSFFCVCPTFMKIKTNLVLVVLNNILQMFIGILKYKPMLRPQNPSFHNHPLNRYLLLWLHSNKNLTIDVFSSVLGLFCWVYNRQSLAIYINYKITLIKSISIKRRFKPKGCPPSWIWEFPQNVINTFIYNY